MNEEASRSVKRRGPANLRVASLRALGPFAFALLLSAGCTSQDDELVGDIGGKQSIEVIVALNRAGIPAERQRSPGRGERYTVTVPPADFARAMQVLHDFQLPSRNEETLEELTAPKGFVPNSREVSGLRLDHALALEVERLIAALAGVSDARVVIRSNLVSEGVAGPKASVVVRYLSPSGTTPFSVDEVKKLVAQTVPGIAAESIEVVPSRLIIPGVAASSALEGSKLENVPLSPFLPFLFRVSASERERALWQLGAMLVMFSCAGGIIGAYFGIRVMRGAARRKGKSDKKNSFFLEASVKADSKSTVALPRGQGGKDLTKPGA